MPRNEPRCITKVRWNARNAFFPMRDIFVRIVPKIGISFFSGDANSAYLPEYDIIQLRHGDDWSMGEDLAHEMIHATGHFSRLNRLRDIDKTCEEYVAMIGSGFLLVDADVARTVSILYLDIADEIHFQDSYNMAQSAAMYILRRPPQVNILWLSNGMMIRRSTIAACK